MNHVTIVIVNWNGKDDTITCLKSLSLLKRDNLLLDIIVVDNGSTDESVKELTIKFPRVHFIQVHKNLGFTGGNNIGIQKALSLGSNFIWLLNNDTVVDKNALMPLFAECSKERVGIVGSKIYFSPGREFHAELYTKKDKGHVLWYAGGIIDWKNMYASHRGVDQVDVGQYEINTDTSFVSGCSMFINRAVIDKIGFLDNSFYLYYEDLDFCLRASKADFFLKYVPKSIIWHKNAGSTDRPGHEFHQYYLTRNRLLIGIRYAPLRTKLALLRESLIFLIKGSSIQKKAIRDAFIGRYGLKMEWLKN